MKTLRGVMLVCACLGAPAGAWRPAPAGASSIPPVVLRSSISVHKVVALTFDDGPSPYSAKVLALLHKYDAHATFFLVGARIPPFRDVVREEVQQGNAIGNHTYSHPDLEWMSAADIRWQLDRAQEEIRSAAGLSPHWFRPPYGAVDERIAALAAAQGMHTVTWSVDPRDWSLPGWNAIVERVLDAVRPGSIVIMHDGVGPRFETVTALAELLPLLKSRGYRFITLDEMFFPHGTVPHRGGTRSSVTLRKR